MIRSELIREPSNLYIKYSVILDLDTLEIIHQKLVRSGYSRIDYSFSAHHTKYNCNDVNEMRIIFSQNAISEISALDISYRNENYKTISIKFGRGFDYYLNIYSSDSEPSDLMEEILAIISEKNIHGYKWITNIIVKCQNLAVLFLIIGAPLVSEIYKIANDWQKYMPTLFYMMIIFSIFVLGFSSKQTVRIISKKEEPFTFKWFLTFKDIAIGSVGSIIGTLILEYMKR